MSVKQNIKKRNNSFWGLGRSIQRQHTKGSKNAHVVALREKPCSKKPKFMSYGYFQRMQLPIMDHNN